MSFSFRIRNSNATPAHVTFTCKVEAAVAEREGAPPRRPRPRRQQHRTMGLKDREAVAAAAVGCPRRLFLYLGLYHDPGPGPFPFRVNSASPASLCCSWSFLGRPAALEGRYSQHPRPGTQQRPCRRSHPRRPAS